MDNDPLIEAIAVALSNEQGRTTFLKMAQAALAAIANSGTHAVMPVKPTTTMTAEGWPPEYFTGDYKAVLRCYKALLAAALVGRKP